MAPLLTLDSYRAIGRNAAAYALGRQAAPVPTEIDNFARAKLIVRTMLMHAKETEAVAARGAAARAVARARRVEALSRRRTAPGMKSLRPRGQEPGVPAMPHAVGAMPWTTTHVC